MHGQQNIKKYNFT